jgi:hypothetical protein
VSKRRLVLSAVSLAICGLVATSVAAPAVAGDGVTDPGDLDPATQQIITETADDPFTDTVQLIQDAGINELNPEFAGSVLVDGVTDGRVVLRYLETSPAAEKLPGLVAELNTRAPLPIVLKPTTVNIGHLRELAQELTEKNGSGARGYGVDHVTGVTYDMITGRTILTTSDPASIERVRAENGTATITVDGVAVEGMYEAENTAEGFQVGRYDGLSNSGAVSAQE